MMRTADVRAVDGYRTILPFAQDYDLLLRLMERGEIANLPDIVLRKREHAGQVTRARSQHPTQVVAGAIAYMSYLSRQIDHVDFVGNGQPLRQAGADFIDRHLGRHDGASADALHHYARFLRYAPIAVNGGRRVEHPYRACIAQALRHTSAHGALRVAAYAAAFLLYNRYKHETLFPDEANLAPLTVQPSATA
jgi:hypothetical protein